MVRLRVQKPDYYRGGVNRVRVDDANPTQTITLTLMHRRKVFIRFCVTPDGRAAQRAARYLRHRPRRPVRGSICALAATRDPLSRRPCRPQRRARNLSGIGKYALPSETADRGRARRLEDLRIEIPEIDDNIEGSVYVSALLANEVLVQQVQPACRWR